MTTLFCGLCGTDIHMLHEGSVGNFVLEEPVVIGHEATARVTKIGSNVKHLKVGDIVCMEPAIPCGNCDRCREGNYNWCTVCNQQAKGLPHTNGFLQKFYNHPAAFCYKVPSTVSDKVGALAEPLAVVVHATRRAGLKIGQGVLVTGAGTMGLLTMLVAKAYGASHVVIADINEARLDLAKELGADTTVHLKRGDDPVKIGERIKNDLIAASGSTIDIDISFECTGTESCTRIAIEASRFGAKIAAVGLGPSLIQLPLATASLKELDIIGVCRFTAGCFTLAVNHLLPILNLEPIVTHVFPIEETMAAFQTMGRGEGIKIMIDCRGK